MKSWVGKIPWRIEWQPTPAILPGESHGQRSLAGYSTQGHKELDMTERLTLSLLSAEWTITETLNGFEKVVRTQENAHNIQVGCQVSLLETAGQIYKKKITC